MGLSTSNVLGLYSHNKLRFLFAVAQGIFPRYFSAQRFTFLKGMFPTEEKIIFSVLTTKRTKYKYYIEVLDQLKQAGATKISIANPNN